MVLNFRFSNSFKIKILFILLVFTLLFSSIQTVRVEAAISIGIVTIAAVIVSGAAAVGAAAVAFAPYVLLAIAAIGTGYMIYKSMDEIVAFAQYLYGEASVVMKSLIESAYVVGDNALIMTNAVRVFLLDKLKELRSMMTVEGATLKSTTIDPSYTSFPSLFSVVPVEKMREKHIQGIYRNYFSFAIKDSIYYVSGIRDASVPSSFGSEILFNYDKAYVNFTGVSSLRAEKSDTSRDVYLDVYKYDKVLKEYTSLGLVGGGNGTLTLGDGLSLVVSSTTKVSSKTSDVNSIALKGLENVVSTSNENGLLDDETITSALLANGFDFLPEVRDYTTDYSPGKTVDVKVSDLVVNPGLTDEEIAANLVSAFPTISGAATVDLNKDIVGVTAENLSDVMIDSGVVTTPSTVTDVSLVEVTEAKGTITDVFKDFAPDIFPMAQNSLKGLENVREEPPVINVDLNKIFDTSVKEISPELASPFEDGETKFFDFSDFNKYKFGGTPLIEYMRMIIGFGFIYSTFLYVWRKFTVSTS